MKRGFQIKSASFSIIIQLLLVPLPALAGNAAYQLAFTTQPSGSTIGASLGNVVVQLADKNGANVLQSGTVVKISLNKSRGFGSITNATTDATGKATFSSLKVNLPGNNYTLLATATGLVRANSQKFNVAKGNATVTVTSSTNNLIYGQSITFTATVKAVAPATNALTGTITFKVGSMTLGSATLNNAGQAASSTKTLRATNAMQVITAIYNGDGNYNGMTSESFVQPISKLALTVSGVTASNKVYNGTMAATLNLGAAALKTIVTGDTVTLNTSTASGAFASKTVGTGKIVTVSGLALAGANAGNYTLIMPAVTANITVRSLPSDGYRREQSL